MMFEFEEFQLEVLAAYREKRDRGELPTELQVLRRAGLRSYAARVLAIRYDKKDDEVLKAFFDPENRYTNHVESIDELDLDKFRPLVNFLNEFSMGGLHPVHQSRSLKAATEHIINQYAGQADSDQDCL